MKKIFLLFSIILGSLFANPSQPVIVKGEVTISPMDKQLKIQASHGSVINWQSFSIARGEITQFIQPSDQSSVLNRVTGFSPSEILGKLEANGHVILLNPNGILIGKDAMIDTAGFLASTLNLSDEDFLKQKKALFTGDSKESIENLGEIHTENGNVTLLAHIVKNEGTIEAPSGKVTFGVGCEILLELENNNNPIFIKPSLDPDFIENKGKIVALQTEIRADGNPYAKAIRIDGEITTPSLVTKGGKIFISSQKASTQIGGSILAKKGDIEINSSDLMVEKEALVEAFQGKVSITGQHCNNEGKISAPEGCLTLDVDSVTHVGTLDVSGNKAGKISIKTVINCLNSGKILANSFSDKGGKIEIVAQDGIIETASSLLSANGLDGGEIVCKIVGKESRLFTSGFYEATGIQGGKIVLLGSDLCLVGTTMDASGEKGGGEILIGGDFQGKNPALQNAKALYVSGSTTIKADALQTGNGGKIILWSDGKAKVFGNISSRGGKENGDGGFVEISGKEHLTCTGHVVNEALHGMKGTLLLDPTNVVIDDATGIYPQYQFFNPNPSGGGVFGTTIVSLANGNVVITNPTESTSTGAVYLFDGLTARLISVFRGNSPNDQVGNGGITTLSTGNFVITSPNWGGGILTDVGAVTFALGSIGVSGVVSSVNSLVGSANNDRVGAGGVTALTNGNYLVFSPNWDNGIVNSAGAVTFGSGTTGIAGVVSASNSLVGSTANDQVGNGNITILTNGNYVVRSSNWINGIETDAGAITFGSGVIGISGVVSSANSLVGSKQNDALGSGGIITLTNGNYVIGSPGWRNGAALNAGAATFGSGLTGIFGIISSSNSLVGSTAGDMVGSRGIMSLTNGNYVVISPYWNNGVVGSQVGAVTFGSGLTGISGIVSALNSLIGSTAGDQVGSNGITILTNGNYVVRSPLWDNGAATNAGAATFGSGLTGISGVVSASNSLVGSTAGDQVGSTGVVALSNGNYVVRSSQWNNGAAIIAGAVTFGSGTTGITGAVSSSNSLVGSTANDTVGLNVTSLTNGNYVVSSRFWNNGAVTDAGAATFGSGNVGISGPVSSSNSLVGGTANDQVSSHGIIALNNGNYVVKSPLWDNGAATNAGAATFGSGTTGITGAVSSANSLVGSVANDLVGIGGITALSNGNYAVVSYQWNTGAASIAGAVTFGSGTIGITGAVSSANSLVGSVANDLVGSTGVVALSNGNYVVLSSQWNNGAATEAGAVTFSSGTIGITGAVSLSNSLVGSISNDRVGSDGITDLTNGNYVVRSPLWDHGAFVNAGAVTFCKSDGSTTGIVTPQNSVVGQAANTNLPTIYVDSQNQTFICPFISEAGGTIRVGLEDPNQLTYLRAEDQTITTTTSFITDTLNQGTHVIIQAINNITINSPLIVTSASSLLLGASPANLTLEAGGSLFINANIDMAQGNLYVVVDSLTPFPNIGTTSQLIIGPGVSINASQAGFWTALRANDHIDPSVQINGASFVPNPNSFNTAEEVWATFFPNGTINPNAPFFTFFYKQQGKTPPTPIPPTPTLIETIQGQDKAAPAWGEFFSLLHPFDEYTSNYLWFTKSFEERLFLENYFLRRWNALFRGLQDKQF